MERNCVEQVALASYRGRKCRALRGIFWNRSFCFILIFSDCREADDIFSDRMSLSVDDDFIWCHLVHLVRLVVDVSLTRHRGRVGAFDDELSEPGVLVR